MWANLLANLFNSCLKPAALMDSPEWGEKHTTIIHSELRPRVAREFTNLTTYNINLNNAVALSKPMGASTQSTHQPRCIENLAYRHWHGLVPNKKPARKGSICSCSVVLAVPGVLTWKSARGGLLDRKIMENPMSRARRSRHEASSHFHKNLSPRTRLN